MSDQADTTPLDPPPAPRPRRLLRSPDDRVLGGVSGGLGAYFRVDPVVFRIGFAVTVFFGGAGALAYLAALVFVPKDDGAGSPVPGRFGGRRALKVLGIAALVLAGISVAGLLFAASGYAAAAGAGEVVAGAVILLGVALVVAALRGGLRRAALPVAALAVTLALPAALVAAADIDAEGGIGERTHRPQTVAAIPADGFRLGMGELFVDLRDLPWKRGDRIALDVRLGVGEVTVMVPEDVCVEATARLGVGEADVLGDISGGVEVDHVVRPKEGDAPRLIVRGDVGIGEFVVSHNRFADRHFDGPDYGDERRLRPRDHGADIDSGASEIGDGATRRHADAACAA